MKKYFLPFTLVLTLAACMSNTKTDKNAKPNEAFNKMLDNYYEERLKLFPLEATQIGDERYDDLLPADFTESYHLVLKAFYTKYIDTLKHYDINTLNTNDRLSHKIFATELDRDLEGLSYHTNYFPFDQFNGVHLTFAQMGSGESFQKFSSVKNYDDFLKRMDAFSVWTDSAIAYMRKGISTGYVLPRVLVEKIIPQLNDIADKPVNESVFYGPVKKMPASFSKDDKEKYAKAYTQAIKEVVAPAYKRLSAFLKDEYLPHARTTCGINALPDGDKIYSYAVRYWTTTNNKPEDIYNTGLKEVARITTEMEKVKEQVGFKGTLQAFFTYLKTDKTMFPFKTPDDVLAFYNSIYKKIEPKMPHYFTRFPKTKFEIRRTEAFRESTASAEYNQGSADGSRPGIFYVPIPDATKFNITSGTESLFLHEAIPGHHYQVSLQQEDTDLPKFRRFGWYGAYGEGWALYCESLGKELGLYTDPYQYMGALGDEMLRAMRLVVDAGMHTGKMTREQAIDYIMAHYQCSKDYATSEIERYMAYYGQALSYKTGSLKIRELRTRYEKELGSKFNIAAFHDEVLRDGCMPLSVFEDKMNAWAEKQK